MKNEREYKKPFIVKSEKALKALPFWLKECGANTFSYSYRNSINVGYDSDPDNDWSKKYQWRGQIRVLDETLFDATCEAIKKAFGWKESAQS